MRFTIKPSPQYGDVRTRVKFAWLPIKIGNVVIWLERYEVDEQYLILGRPYDIPRCWWDEVERRLCE